MNKIWRTSFCGAKRMQETSSHRNMGIMEIVYSWLRHCWFWKFPFNRLLSSWLTIVLVAWFHSVFQLWCYFPSSPISPSIPQPLFCETTNQARPEFSKAGETRWLLCTCHHTVNNQQCSLGKRRNPQFSIPRLIGIVQRTKSTILSTEIINTSKESLS